MTEYTFARHVWIVGLTNLNERRGCRMNKEAAALGAKKGHVIGSHMSKNGCELMLFKHPDFAKSLENIRQRVSVPDKEVKT